MRLHHVLLTAHILAAILTIGWLAMNSMVMPGMIRRGPESAGFVRGGADLGKKIGPASALVLLLGLWLVGEGGAEIGDGWVGGAILIYVVTAVIGAVPMAKAEERAAGKLAAGQRADEEARTLSILGGISGVLLVVIVYLMVAKPGA